MKNGWQKDLFSYHGGYLTYDRKFVARFKYGKGYGEFKRFLVKHFTPSEYFNLIQDCNMSPGDALKSKGFMTKMQKERCAKWGLEATEENAYRAFLMELSVRMPEEYTAERVEESMDLWKKDQKQLHPLLNN